MRAQIVGVLLAAGPRRCYVPVGHDGAAHSSRLSWDDVRAALAPLMEDPGRPKWCHDAKRRADPFASGRYRLLGVAVDTMLASYSLNPEGGHDLPDAAMRWIDRFLPTWKQRLSEAGAGRPGPRRRRCRRTAAAAALAEEAEVMRELAPLLEDRLRDDDLWDLYRHRAAAGGRAAGDGNAGRPHRHRLFAAAVRRAGRADTAADRVHLRTGGRKFNINSPKQLSTILFRQAAAAGGEADKNRAVHRPGSAGDPGRAARAAPEAPGLPPADQAEEHVHRRTAGAGASGNGAGAHPFQPDGDGHGAAEQHQSQLAEHSRAHRGRAGASARRSFRRSPAGS